MISMMKEFKANITRFESVDHIWFTTFALNIQFFEKYILPTIIGEESPKTMRDFEILEQKYIDSEIDIRIFCDMGLMNNSDMDKNTSVPIHPIALAQIPGKEDFFSRGVFHPKVICIQGEEKSTGAPLLILGCGSANLTLQGWGRNVEAFSWKKIEDQENLSRVDRFFSQLFTNNGTQDEYEAPTPVIKQVSDDYLFVHSFMDGDSSDFIRHMDCGSSSHLTVISPFFGGDLQEVISKLQFTSNDLQIVPDHTSGIKITKNNHEYIMGKLYTYPFDNSHAQMVHAKIWITDSLLGIGSWNLTLPGINAADKSNNIEAGFIMEESLPTGKSLKALLFTEEDLIAEAEELEVAVDRFTDWLSLSVVFDWSTHMYEVVCEKEKDNDFSILLPGAKVCSLQSQTILIENIGEIIKNKVFSIRRTIDQKEIQRGFITEVNRKNRIGWFIPTLNDMFSHYIIDDAADEVGKNRSIIYLQQKSESELLAEVSQTGLGSSYFVMFKALHSLEIKLDELKKTDQVEYEKTMYTYPGSLMSLCRLAEQLIDEPLGFRELQIYLLFKEILNLTDIHKMRKVACKDFKEHAGAWMKNFLSKHSDGSRIEELYEKVKEEFKYE